MNTTKSLALAAITALSLGIGSAMAQEGGSLPADFYGVINTPTVSDKAATPRIQAGSPDANVGSCLAVQWRPRRPRQLRLSLDQDGEGKAGVRNGLFHFAPSARSQVCAAGGLG
jgi:hypothetical protein